jgi:hypothetical protein
MSIDRTCPNGWDESAHTHWLGGDRLSAIKAALAAINRHGLVKPAELVLQVCYYFFLIGDYAAAAMMMERCRAHHPDHQDLLINHAVFLTRDKKYEAALALWHDFLTRQPDNPFAFDGLCVCYHGLGRDAEAAAAGTRSLMLKDQRQAGRPPNWTLPPGSAAAFADSPDKTNVVSVSLWGSGQRYLRGALDNALSLPRVYPGWVMRVYLDETVPPAFRQDLADLGADIRLEPPNQSNRQRLAWRFKVADDPSVGRFLVRDTDSVINDREQRAVAAWIASDHWFHVMRDWWTHTDLILAGMWGGIAGILPSLTAMLATYRPPTMETPNIDQCFLRDRVWPYVRQSCLVHDRCFSPTGARPWPGPAPDGDAHVGQNVFAAGRADQEARRA